MASVGRLVVAVSLIGLLSTTHAAAPADASEKPVAVDELQKGLMAALGDSFEYVGGELGRARDASTGSGHAERFWFAKVRPKKAGEFAFTYCASFDIPADAKKKIEVPDRAEYTMPMKVGERGAPRILRPGNEGGTIYPSVNVGDTLIVPIHVDRPLTGHTFAACDKEDPAVKAYFSVANENIHERYMKLAATTRPVVRTEAADQLQLLASWGSTSVNRSLTENHHWLTAYLEFTKIGEFNLAGRLVDAEGKAEDAGSAFCVVPKDEPVTATLESIWPYRRGYTSSGYIGCGTLEVRIGDRVLIGCGEYTTGAKRVDGYRSGVVVVRPFKALELYTPEEKK